MFNLFRTIEAATAQMTVGIPISIRKQTEGKCIRCGHVTETQDDGDWLHKDCRDILIAEQREEDRLNDPRHGQAAELNGRYR